MSSQPQKPTADALWQTFTATGSVADYLRYREQKKEAADGNDAHHPRAHHTGKQQYR